MYELVLAELDKKIGRGQRFYKVVDLAGRVRQYDYGL